MHGHHRTRPVLQYRGVLTDGIVRYHGMFCSVLGLCVSGSCASGTIHVLCCIFWFVLELTLQPLNVFRSWVVNRYHQVFSALAKARVRKDMDPEVLKSSQVRFRDANVMPQTLIRYIEYQYRWTPPKLKP